MFVDTHCHIQFKGLDEEKENMIARARNARVLMNLVGTQKDTSKRAVELAMKHVDMWASIGTHPNHVFPTYMVEEESSFMSREEDFDFDYYDKLYQMAPEKIIGVGETGIDFYHIPSEDEVPFETVMKKQRQVFLDHWKFSREHDLSLVVHVRDPKKEYREKLPSAHETLLSVIARSPQATSQSRENTASDEIATPRLREARNDRPLGVIHCYSGNWTQAQRYIDLGFYLGFTGVITYPTRKSDPGLDEALQEVIRNVPLDKIVVETDSPYLAPQKYRGKRNEPAYVVEVVRYIAEVKGVSVEELEEQIYQNTLRLFPKIHA